MVLFYKANTVTPTRYKLTLYIGRQTLYTVAVFCADDSIMSVKYLL